MSLKVIAYNTYLISSIRIKYLFYTICIIAPMLRKIKATNINSNEKLLLNAIHFIARQIKQFYSHIQKLFYNKNHFIPADGT